MARGAGPPLRLLLLLLLQLLALPAGRGNRTGPGESRPGMRGGGARRGFGDAPGGVFGGLGGGLGMLRGGPGLGQRCTSGSFAWRGGGASLPAPGAGGIPWGRGAGYVKVSGDLSAARPRELV